MDRPALPYRPGSLADIAYGPASAPLDRRTSAILRQWWHRPIAENPITVRVLERLDKTTAEWPDERRYQIVGVIVAIVEAEQSRRTHSPGSLNAIHRRLAQDALATGRLALRLGTSVPQPPEAVRALIAQLLTFTAAVLREASASESAIAIEVARGQHTDTVLKIRLTDQAKFVELAMKHLGLLKERVEVEGKMTLEQLIVGSCGDH